MTKLLITFRAAPTAANAAKIKRHIVKHPMSALYLTPTDMAAIRKEVR